MRQVASEATTHAFKPALRNPARPAPNSERAHGLPFESLLSDGTQSPASPPPQSPPASADKTERAMPSDSAKAPAKARDGKAEKPSDNAAAGNAAKTVTTASDGKVADDDKATADGKTGTQTAAGDDPKPAGDGKPTDGSATMTLAADSATNPIQTTTPAAALAAAPAPATATPAAAAAIPQTAPATDQVTIVAADTPKAKMGDLANPQVDPDKAFAIHPQNNAPATTHHASIESPPPIATDAQAAAPKMTGDIAQQMSLIPRSQDVSALTTPTAPAASAAPMAQPAAVPLAGVAIEIAGMALAGMHHFEIRLDPPELGRIEVRLNVDRDGHVTSRLIADRSDTLDLLRRDASGLERALQDAGLKTSDNGLQFSLRDQTMGREQSHTPTPTIAQIVVNDSALPPSDATQRNYSRLAGLRGGIDIRV